MTSAPDPLLVEIDAWLGSAAPHWIQYDDDKCAVLLRRARDRLHQYRVDLDACEAALGDAIQRRYEAQEQERKALNDWHKAMDELAEMRGQLAQTQERSGDEQDPEWQEIPPLDPTKLPRCPKCRTYGHEHRKDCPYVGSGMNHHVYPARAAEGKEGRG